MRAVIRFGFRLTLRGGRESLVRLVVMALAVALGVAMLISTLAIINALSTQNARGAWLAPSAQGEPPSRQSTSHFSSSKPKRTRNRRGDRPTRPASRPARGQGSQIACSLAPDQPNAHREYGQCERDANDRGEVPLEGLVRSTQHRPIDSVSLAIYNRLVGQNVGFERLDIV
jgi:hypothetical protein